MTARMHLVPVRIALAVALLCLPAAGLLSAASPDLQVKAAYLVNFAKLTEWPSGALGQHDDPFQVCLIAHRDGIGPALSNLSGKAIQGHALQVRQGVRLGELRSCNMVVLEGGDEGRLASVIDTLDEAPVLTVGDFDDFSRRGGMIELASQDNRIVFDINRDTTSRAGLIPSAQLLKLARVVRQKR
jgi:hypothetical protein